MSDPFSYPPQLSAEQQAIRAKCFHPTGTFEEFKEEEIEQSISERFEKIVRKYPENMPGCCFAAGVSDSDSDFPL